jgi:hypothetical protein
MGKSFFIVKIYTKKPISLSSEHQYLQFSMVSENLMLRFGGFY